MKKILIPTDFSSNAGDALAYALDFVGSTKAIFHIVNVVIPDTGPSSVPGAAAVKINNRMDYAQEQMKALEAMGQMENRSNITISTNVYEGVTSVVVKREAEKMGADLIILGTRGTNHDLIDKLLGTVSSAILNDAPCPVILVPKGYQYQTMDNIIFSTNLNHSDPYELWRATEAIKPLQPAIRCVHIVETEEDKDNHEIEDFAKYMIEKSSANETIFNIEVGKNIEDIIEKYAEEYDAELIVMHREKKSLWTKIIGKSHTRRMTSTLRIPLMVIN